jgi:glycosyltransferase involved in cell wall biosynthesis
LELKKNVIIAGNFSYSEIPEIHNLADIFVLPSIPVKNWQEQFGMVLVEALASGKPVISTLCGSIPEVIGNAGILIQPNDPLSLYYAIKKLIIDEDLREKYSKLARTRAEDIFNPEKIALNLKREYEKLIAR